MRASLAVIVVLGLFASSQALDFSTDTLVETGTNLVNSLVESLKQKALEAGKALLGKLTGLLGKREVMSLSDKFGKFKNYWEKTKDHSSKLFKAAVEKLKDVKGKFMSKLGLWKDTKEVADDVDDVVAEHHVQQKRIISDLIQKGKDLFGSAVNFIKNTASSLKAKASELVSGLLQKGTDVLVGKRATLGEHLTNIGKAVGSALSPFKDIVAGLGNTLKGHFSNLVDTVKGHVKTLSGKLSGHVDDLKKHGSTLLEHGKNAVGALGEVVTDILKQTVSNAQPAIDGLSKTAVDAGNTIVNHFTGGSN